MLSSRIIPFRHVSSRPALCVRPERKLTYPFAAWSGAADICLALLPWTIISRMTLNKKERLGVLLAMSTGIIAGLTSIAKTATLGAISNPDTSKPTNLRVCVPLSVTNTTTSRNRCPHDPSNSGNCPIHHSILHPRPPRSHQEYHEHALCAALLPILPHQHPGLSGARSSYYIPPESRHDQRPEIEPVQR